MEKLKIEITEFLIDTGIDANLINDQLELLGDDSKVKSRDLVEILLIIEDFLDENYDVEFDWSSSNAMSSASSNFRTLGTLYAHVSSFL